MNIQITLQEAHRLMEILSDDNNRRNEILKILKQYSAYIVNDMDKAIQAKLDLNNNLRMHLNIAITNAMADNEE